MRILLAEDEKALSNVLVDILKHDNYLVDAVFNGEDAINFLNSDIYDCAILDIMMPKVDGITVCKTIRSRGNKIPVLLLTAKNEIEDKVLGLDSGADDYLTKPFNTKELLARVRALCRRQNSDLKDNNLTYGDIELNRKTFEIISSSKKILLTSKEFQIMEMLMQNPAKIISSEWFMEKIWGYDSDAEITVVWTYISYLRKKLQILSSNVIIKGVRNLGYRLEIKND